MNREIKFRGKRLDNGEWIRGCLVSVEDTAIIVDKDDIVWDPNTDVRSFWYDAIENEVDSKTVGQFTGLYGFKIGEFSHLYKADQEAYYGDIIKFVNTEGDVFIKELWWNEELQCTMVGPFPYYRLHESGFIQPSKLEFQIIGNIHDNPELLKGGE